MTTPEFVHLHNHSQYSLLDGAIRVKELAKAAKTQGMRAVGLTDHGNMFGAIQHHKACAEQGVLPIFGCEVNVAAASGDGHHHLVLLAENQQGYKNLIRIVTEGQIRSARADAPVIHLETLDGRTEGVIGLTGCMGGVVAQAVLEGGKVAGQKALDDLAMRFGKGSLYVELQDHQLIEQTPLLGILTELAKDLALPTVATNDCHFPARTDGEAHLFLSCIAANRTFAEALQSHHGSHEMFFKSAAEMAEIFRDAPTALRATVEIAERCSGLKLRLGEPMLPRFSVPDGFTEDSYFRHVAREGLAARFREFTRPVDEAAYRARLELELDVIEKMQFAGYFLIVWDFIRFAKEAGIPVGPGRGSGAGSLVAYSMRITDLDPIPYGLLFERFLNPERVSMPDFDIDFCMDRRDEVIQYVSGHYGKDSVGQIATFHELKARSVIKDVARAMGIAPTEAQKIANLIPQKGPGVMYTLEEALEVEPKLKALIDTDDAVKELVEQARRLEGLTRHAGMHAAGVVISEGALWDHVPCFQNGDQLVTQYHKDDVEAAGLVKFDFLGLKTLTVLDIAVRLVNARPDRAGQSPLRLDQLSLDDAGTYALLQTGETTGVFQLESSGMQQLFKDLRPDAFEDIVAAVALYRPGPLGTGMVKDFVDCKHGRKPIAQMHPLVDDLLKPTYGVIVYQEQVMQIAQRLAGYTLGSADLLRRAMGKKKAEEMAKQKAAFVEGSIKNGVVEADAERIFGLLEFFAGYGFNKSHSAAYALLTYHTAYLKAHYPVEFLCALMTADRDKTEKVVRIIAEGRAWGVEILPPEVNESDIHFSVVYRSASDAKAKSRAPKGNKRKQRADDPLLPAIRFGLGAIRGVGEAALESVLEARKTAPFKDLFDFAERTDPKRTGKGVLEALVQSGAFDALHGERDIVRAQAFASIERAIERSKSAMRDRESGQASLFGSLTVTQAAGNEFIATDPWDSRETLAREKSALGFYVSGHPLDRFTTELGRIDATPLSGVGQLPAWSKVRLAGMVEGYRERVFKGGGGGKVAFFTLEDRLGRIEVKVREKQIAAYGEVLSAGEPVLVSGKLSYPFVEEEDPDAPPREPTLLLDEAFPLTDKIVAETKSVAIRLLETKTTVEKLRGLADILKAHPGNCPVQVRLQMHNGVETILGLGSGMRVQPSDQMLAGLERIFGEKVVELR